MAWRDVLKLLEMAGGDLEQVDPARLNTATSIGRGDAETQIRIAMRMYDVKYRKEADSGQTKWNFA